MADDVTTLLLRTSGGEPVDLGSFTVDELTTIVPGAEEVPEEVAAAALRSLVVRGHATVGADGGITFVERFGVLADLLSSADGVVSLAVGNGERWSAYRVPGRGALVERAVAGGMGSQFEILERRDAAEALAGLVLEGTPDAATPMLADGDPGGREAIDAVLDGCLRYVLVHCLKTLDEQSVWFDDIALVVDRDGALWRLRFAESTSELPDIVPMPRRALAPYLWSLVARPGDGQTSAT